MEDVPPDRMVTDLLERLGIAYTRREHPAVYTVEQARNYDAGIPGAHCKNLFLRNKKGDRHFLAVFDERTPLDLRDLGRKVGAGPLGFASPERLERILGLTPGAVGPFGLLHPAAREVIVLLDAGLGSASHVSFHPNINTATLTLRYSEFIHYLDFVGNPRILIGPP